MTPKIRTTSAAWRALVLFVVCALVTTNTWATDEQRQMDAEKSLQTYTGDLVSPTPTDHKDHSLPMEPAQKESLSQRVKPLLFLAGGLLLSASTWAARVIGDGGGEVEMRALTFVAEIPQWFKFCAMSNNPCGLSSAVFRRVVEAVSSTPTPKAPLVKFSYEPNALMNVDRENNLIEIPATQSDLEMRARLLFAFAELYAIEPIARDQLTQELMQNLFAHSVTDRQESLINDRYKLVVFVLPDRVIPSIGVEEELIDFTERLRLAVRCPEANRFSAMKIHIRQSTGFVAEVSGVCQNQSFAAKVFVTTSSNDVSAWSIRTFASSTDFCPQLLIDPRS